MASNHAYYIAKQRRVLGTTDTLRIAILVGRYFKYLDQINTHPGVMDGTSSCQLGDQLVYKTIVNNQLK